MGYGLLIGCAKVEILVNSCGNVALDNDGEDFVENLYPLYRGSFHLQC